MVNFDEHKLPIMLIYKKIFLVAWILLLNNTIHAQNWNTIIPSDTNYFAVQATGVDSIWQGYLRCIFVDSSQVVGGVTTNYFYPSIRLDMNNITDSAGGDTWLGKANIHLINDDEIFFNQYHDSLRIRTNASVGGSWSFSVDSNGIEYIATVVSIDTLSIDGVIDSIKTIQLQAYNGLTPVSSIYNSLPIELSKDHGLIQCFEFFAFPYYSSPKIAGLNPIPYLEFPFPILPLIHKRVDRDITYINLNEDLLWKYQPGNEWSMVGSSNGGTGIVGGNSQDSIISSQMISADSIQVIHQIHSFIHEKLSPSGKDTFYQVLNIRTDTFNTYPYMIHGLVPEHKLFGYWSLYNRGFVWYSIGNYCSNRLTLHDTSYTQSLVSGNTKHSETRYQGFGIGNDYYYFDNTINIMEFGDDMVYYNLDSCFSGIKINLYGLGLENYNLNEQISVYPNPTSSAIHILLPFNIGNYDVVIMNSQGQIIMRKKIDQANSSFLMDGFNSGIYFLEIKTANGIAFKKIIKE